MRQDYSKIISAKDLGKLALSDFCPACFWIERKLGKPPALFPSIFSLIDVMTKKNVHWTFFNKEKAPDWLPLEDIKEVYEGDVSFKLPVEAGNWILTGRPDDIFLMKDKTYHIVDYKTAKFTGKQDELFPLYEIQLNAYAFLAERYGLNPVSKLSLVYCEPDQESAEKEELAWKFKIYRLEVGLNQDKVLRMLSKAREIIEEPNPPKSRACCKGICNWINRYKSSKICLAQKNI